MPEPVAEGGEEQRRRLAGDPRDGHHDARDDSGARRGEHDAQSVTFHSRNPRRQPASRSDVGHQPDHLLGRAEHDRAS